MTISNALHRLRDSFAPVAGEFALPEAERVLTFLLDCSRSYLYTHGNDTLTGPQEGRIGETITRRACDEPLAYILGSAYFYDREFTVSPDVLIPRPDTEILVEEVLKREPDTPIRMIDLGTGSGCIAAVLAAKRPAWFCLAADRSFAALRIAAKNGTESMSLLCADLLAAIKHGPRFDIIVANPPYIPSRNIPSLDRSVRDFEPMTALDGGPDGLDYFRYLARHGASVLMPEGCIYCEIGHDQGDSASGIFAGEGWREVTVSRDLGNRPRVVRAMAPAPQRSNEV